MTGTERSITVLVVDDQVLIRAGLVALLRAAPGFEVVGEAADGETAVTIVKLVSTAPMSAVRSDFRAMTVYSANSGPKR